MENRGPRQRDQYGRFLPGNQVSKGHGRKPRALEEQYMHALVQSMPIEQFLKVCAAQAVAAESDVAVFRTFLERLLGKVRESAAREALSVALREMLLDLGSALEPDDDEEPDGEPS